MACAVQRLAAGAAPTASYSTGASSSSSNSALMATRTGGRTCTSSTCQTAPSAAAAWHAGPDQRIASRLHRQRCDRLHGRTAAAPIGVVAELSVTPVALVLPGVAAAAAGVAALRFYLYSQLEYITAAMLTKYVPRGEATASGKGAAVVQLGGGTKELFYYPKDTVMVTAVGETLNKGLLEQAGMTAAVPTLVKVRSPAELSFQATGSVDAVVSLCALGQMQPAQRAAAVREAQRVLRPGCPLIFLEKLAEGGSPLRPLLGGDAGSLTTEALGALLPSQGQGAFEYVEWSVALEGQDPHAVGVAVRGAVGPGRSKEERAAAKEQERGAKKRAAAPLPKTKGFTG